MKKEYQDDFEKYIKGEFDRQAENEIKAVENDESLADMPESLKVSLRQKIDARIKESEEAKSAYENLSEEDRKALELGRKMLEEGNTVEFKEPKRKGLSRRGKLRLKHALGVAAVLAVVMLVEVNSLGGPEKVVQLVRQQVAEREVEKINSSPDSKVIVKENEEEAYQTIADEFGVEPVRIRERPKGMKFEELELDENLQMAEMNYTYKKENIRYMINTTHNNMAIGNGFEDKLTEKYWIENAKTKILIKEYETPETKEKYYSASYEYNNVEYSLTGIMSKSEFENIINNLFFY